MSCGMTPLRQPGIFAVSALLLACHSESSNSSSRSVGTAGSSSGTTGTVTKKVPVIRSFSAAPASISQGESSTLSWQVEGATEPVVIDGLGSVPGDSVVVTPTATTTYKLIARNSDGESSAITAVTVKESCVPSTYEFPPGPSFAIRGTQSTGHLTRTIEWKPGAPEKTITTPRTVKCATLSPSTAADADDGKAISDAIKGCADDQVVYLNPGKYQIKTSIVFGKSRVTLRGSGGPGVPAERQTQLIGGKDLLGAVVTIGSGIYQELKKADASSANLTAVSLQGTSQAAVADTSGLKPGDLVILDQETDPDNDAMFSPFANLDMNNSTAVNDATTKAMALWPLDVNADGTIKPAYPYAMFDSDMPPNIANRSYNRRMNRPIAQMVEISTVDDASKSVTFSSPLHMAFVPALKAQIANLTGTVVDACGVEDLYITLVPSPNNNNRKGSIAYVGAKHSWAKNIESHLAGITMSAVWQCTLRDSYIHETYNVTPGGAGYGLTVDFGSADNLIENNIVWNYNKMMVAPGSGGGNVYSYNYMDDAWISYHPNFVESGIEASHGSTPHFALFEGNLTFSFGTDPTHGNNIFMTWLRNVATLHRSAWPPLNAYRVQNSTQSDCVPPPGYSDKCEAYSDWANRVGAIIVFGDYYYSYVGNVIGSLDTPMAPQMKGKFVYDSPVNEEVAIWEVGYGLIRDGKEVVDQNVVATLYRDANYDIANNDVVPPEAAGKAIPKSLYLCGKPAFFGHLEWPWVDGSSKAQPYRTREYTYYPLSTGLGTFVTPDLDPASTPTTQYKGFQLPAFIRFLQLRGIEAPPSACSTASPAAVSSECSLLITGNAP